MIHDDALAYIKSHKKELIVRYADVKFFPPVKNPGAYFMAGSPGAGKTEYSKGFIYELEVKDNKKKIVRIDADDIREFLPMYDHKNSSDVQEAAVFGVEKLLNQVIEHNQEFLLDATFANYEKSYMNITRCLHDKRKVGIYYIYQDPLIAWRFTLEREAMEGRKIPKSMFIKAFFNAKENVNKIKREFGKDIELTLIKKNYIEGKQGVEKVHLNIDNIDSYLKIEYNPSLLEEKISE